MSDTARNLIQMTVSSVASAGLGTLTLGSAVADYLAFEAGDDGLTFTVTITETGVGQEVNTGCTYTHSGTTLTRGTLEKSTTGAAIAFSSAAIVSVTASAAWGNRLEYQLNRGYTAVSNSSGVTQTKTGAGTTKIDVALDNVSSNPFTWWDTTNKQFLPTRAGNYLCFASIQRNLGAGVTTLAVIRKNGTGLLIGAVSTAANSVDIVSGILEVNGTTDYLDLAWYTSATLTTITNAEAVSFRVIYLGP